MKIDKVSKAARRLSFVMASLVLSLFSMPISTASVWASEQKVANPQIEQTDFRKLEVTEPQPDVGSVQWWDNTGTTLPQIPNYKKYDLIHKVKAGDIIFQGTGLWGLTGHVAMVEGIFHDKNLNTDYIRVIESNIFTQGKHVVANGVVRSVLDDNKADFTKTSIYRVNNSSQSKIAGVVNFEINQLGKHYNIDYFKYSSSPNNKSWYCSELVWAAWKNQGVNIENSSWTRTPGVISPRDVTSFSQKTARVFKSQTA
jgi:uncharacterized protein YycO